MSMYGVEDHTITCGPGRTKQSMKAECDINLIVAKFEKSGLLTHVSQGLPSFVDVSEMTDYRSAMEHVRSVEEYFAGLPAAVRARFVNDPIEFMEYLDSGASEEDLRALGLEVLGDRRARAHDGREGDEVVADVVPAPEETPEPE